MKLNRPLVPDFLQKAENRLLANKPTLWSTRTYLVVYYGVVFMLALALLAWLVPDDPRSLSSIEYWVGFVSIISILALTFWLIYLLRFNVFKRYGNIGRWHMLAAFILYFIAAGTIVLFAYVHPVVESLKANLQYSDDELVQDINRINSNICRLEYNSINHNWKKDTVIVDTSEEIDRYGYEESIDRTVVEMAAPYKHMKVNGDWPRLKMEAGDSIIKINDTLYVSYETPVYAFLTSYRAADRTSEKLLSSRDIFHQVIKPYEPPNRKDLERQVEELLSKYTSGLEKISGYSNTTDKKSREDAIRDKYRIYHVQHSLDNIFNRKHRFSDNTIPALARVFYYFTLVVTLLVFLFRFSSKRTYFLSLLAGVILTILTALMIAFSGNSGISFFAFLVFYFIVFFGISLTAWRNRSRKVVTGIALNLFIFLTPFFPSLVASLYYSIRSKKMLESEDYEAAVRLSQEWEGQMVYMEIAGFVLLFILLGTYISRVYRRWYALPQE